MTLFSVIAEWSLKYSLTNQDILLMFFLSSMILNLYAILSYACISSTKKLAWSISLFNSGLMSVAGIVYIAAKVHTHIDAFKFGYDAPKLFYGYDNLSVLICIWFGLANLADLFYGLVMYRQYLGVLTTYVHHSIFMWMMFYAPTGNGIIIKCPPFAPAFCVVLIEEIPTFILALGSVFPSCRTDLGFGISFFIFRILYHLYFTVYAIYSQVTATVIVLYLLTLAMHVNWFYAWISKYAAGSYSGIRASKDKKTK